MPNCKICGKAVESGIVMHRACRIDRSLKVMEIVCDQYCRYPREIEDEDKLDEICMNCKVVEALDLD